MSVLYFPSGWRTRRLVAWWVVWRGFLDPHLSHVFFMIYFTLPGDNAPGVTRSIRAHEYACDS